MREEEIDGRGLSMLMLSWMNGGDDADDDDDGGGRMKVRVREKKDWDWGSSLADRWVFLRCVFG